MERKCPLCGALYSAPPALSRKDNKTPVCPSCGVRQALEAANVNSAVQAEIIKVVENSYPES